MQSQLLQNQWFGKAVGFTLAFVFAPHNHTILSMYVILGIALGHAFDSWAARRAGATFSTPDSLADRDHPTRLVFLKFLFGAMGHVARQSGTILAPQIEIAERTIKALSLERVDAISWFTAGKQGKTAFSQLARKCQPVPPDWQSLLTRCLIDTVAVQPSDAALAATVKLAGLVGVAPGTIAEQFGTALKGAPQSGHQRAQPNHPPGHRQSSSPDPALVAAYQELGLRPDASRREVKQAYRRLASQYHPDKLGPDSTERQQQIAQEQMVRISQAMETIKAQK